MPLGNTGRFHTTCMALVMALAITPNAATAQQSAQTSAQTLALHARTQELRRDMVRVSDRVYTAVGYSPANISMIVGDSGVIFIDTGMAPPHAAQALADFRQITDLPVVAIIYTHGHGDHTGGAGVLAQGATPQVWAREGFGSEGDAFASAGLTIQNVRGDRQGGFRLPPEQRINNGIALAFAPPRAPAGGSVFSGNQSLAPTHSFSGERQTLEIAGVTLEMVAAPGETEDQLYVWLPEGRVLFSGDNFYGSWPNAYAIRGTPYRDVRAWANANDTMLREGAVAMVPGHTRPILGEAEVAQALTDYRDAINFVVDKTIEGMNLGLTPDELVGYVRLPENLASKPYLGEYYGNVEWAVRAIFQGYLGWFDGNPTNLFSLPPQEQARRMAALAGGQEELMLQARTALAQGDAVWAAQLADHLIALDPQGRDQKIIKADALTIMADNLLTATGRNYLLTIAQELRAPAGAP
jgi:alkyl sulfatase BDS1-like metallo-beta-lactamase superfamily hydrolase